VAYNRRSRWIQGIAVESFAFIFNKLSHETRQKPVLKSSQSVIERGGYFHGLGLDVRRQSEAVGCGVLKITLEANKSTSPMVDKEAVKSRLDCSSKQTRTQYLRMAPMPRSQISIGGSATGLLVASIRRNVLILQTDLGMLVNRLFITSSLRKDGNSLNESGSQAKSL
jgi:hypothetical protein